MYSDPWLVEACRNMSGAELPIEPGKTRMPSGGQNWGSLSEEPNGSPNIGGSWTGLGWAPLGGLIAVLGLEEHPTKAVAPVSSRARVAIWLSLIPLGAQVSFWVLPTDHLNNTTPQLGSQNLLETSARRRFGALQ